MLSLQARKKFKIVADPFTGDVTKAEDVYMTSDTRFIAEYLYQTARVGGMVALIGESGSGKTTIRRYAIDRMQTEGQKGRVIIPRIIDKSKLTAFAMRSYRIARKSIRNGRLKQRRGKSRES